MPESRYDPHRVQGVWAPREEISGLMSARLNVTTTTTEHSDGGAGGQRPSRPCLSVVHHPNAERLGLRIPVTQGSDIEIGRGGTALGAGVMDDRKLSRRHARISWDDGGFVISDKQSHNGTYVNGQRVDTASLAVDDVIGVGSILLLFHEAPLAFRVPEHPKLIGVSYEIATTIEQIEQVAPHPSTVLVLGETGTGKEVVAREIHDLSLRRGRFAAVNCGGVADGVLQTELFGTVRGAFSGADRDRAGMIEACDGGTLLLDEIGDASPALQRSLLRVLQENVVRRVGSNIEKTVDTRFIAATNRPLLDLVDNGEFREDLYARLSGWIIRLAPLRTRKEDIPHLVQHFVLTRAGSSRPIHRALATRLLAYDYPRNVRELEKIVERALIESDDALRLSPGIESLLPAIDPTISEPAAPSVAKGKRPAPTELRALLAARGGNVTQLAHELGVARNTLYRWLESGIHRGRHVSLTVGSRRSHWVSMRLEKRASGRGNGRVFNGM